MRGVTKVLWPTASVPSLISGERGCWNDKGPQGRTEWLSVRSCLETHVVRQRGRIGNKESLNCIGLRRYQSQRKAGCIDLFLSDGETRVEVIGQNQMSSLW